MSPSSGHMLLLAKAVGKAGGDNAYRQTYGEFGWCCMLDSERALQLRIYAWRFIWQQFIGDVNEEAKPEAFRNEADEDLDASSK